MVNTDTNIPLKKIRKKILVIGIKPNSPSELNSVLVVLSNIG